MAFQGQHRRRLHGRRGLRVVVPTASGGGDPPPPADPEIDGTPWVGETLTVLNPPSGATFQWKRDGADIAGETSSTYDCVAADIGPEITCAVNGADLDPVQAYFDTIAERGGDADDLAICFDFRDVAAGSVTTITDRAGGLVMNATGVTCGTTINSKPTLVFTGSAGQGMLSATTADRLTGASALTSLCAPQDSSVAGQIIWAHGPNTGATGVARVRLASGGVCFFDLTGDVGGNSISVTSSLATATVRTHSGDFAKIAYEAGDAWIDGVKQTVSGTAGSDNTPTTGLSSQSFAIGRRTTGEQPFSGSLVGALVIYRRALTHEERVHAELIMGYLCGITITVEAEPASPGVAFGFGPGQSNSVGTQSDTLGDLPATWPPADTADRLKEFVPADQSIAALEEPVNGLGGTHYVSFLDGLARTGPHAAATTLVAAPAPPVSGTLASEWLPGTANYNRLVGNLYHLRTMGYEIGGMVAYIGEANAINESDALAYAADMQSIFAAARALLGADLRIIVVKLNAAGGRPYWDTVNDAIDGFADANTLVVENNYELADDNLHLTSLGQMELGEAIAAAYIAKWPS